MAKNTNTPIELPFLGSAYEGRSKSLNAQQSINLFPVLDRNEESKSVVAMYNTPGLVEFSDTGTSAIVRSIHVMRDKLYAVVGNTVYEVTTEGVATSLGVITTSTGHVGMATNGTQLLIVDGTDSGHLVVGGVLVDIADTDFPAATDCIFFDGYFVVTVLNTGKIQISKLYDGLSWDPLDFATAEASPDNLVGIGSTQQNIWLFGDHTIEIYYNSGNVDFPFQRVPGGIIDIGCLSLTSLSQIEGVLYWLTDERTVVKSNGYGFEVISTTGINYQISTYDTVDDAVGYTYTSEGFIFYVLDFPTENKTWVCNAKTFMWHEWSSVI